MFIEYSNTTLVKVKYYIYISCFFISFYSNTTLVKVKCTIFSFYFSTSKIQIQHLLKLNARKINLYDFHYTIKSIDTQGF